MSLKIITRWHSVNTPSLVDTGKLKINIDWRDAILSQRPVQRITYILVFLAFFLNPGVCNGILRRAVATDSKSAYIIISPFVRFLLFVRNRSILVKNFCIKLMLRLPCQLYMQSIVNGQISWPD